MDVHVYPRFRDWIVIHGTIKAELKQFRTENCACPVFECRLNHWARHELVLEKNGLILIKGNQIGRLPSV
jgi:hypothetical protein